MDLPSLSFSPERCADLHNRLLAKSIEHLPARRTERNLVARFLDAAPEFAEIPSLPELPLYRFLALLDTTPIFPGRVVDMLTPYMYQPDPTIFWSEPFEDEPSFILLYAQNSGDAPMDGGVFLDIVSYKAVWHERDFLTFPPADQWLPLEVLLQRSLDAWETGKFYWDVGQASMAIRSWTQNDVEEALVAWNRLLSSIELRISSGTGNAPHRLEPLSSESLAPFNISTFAAEFLTRAQRPGFSFNAPGINTFTPELFVVTYTAEAPGSTRQTRWLGDSGDEDWPTLLFPGIDTVPLDVSDNPNMYINSFDRDWGFGKFTVNRQSGLYVIADTKYSDVVRLIASSGLPNACEFRHRFAWGPPRDPKLAEVLRHWASLVEEGTWSVDSNGVCTDHEWFNTNTHVAKVPPCLD
ncbi:hypothetical protein GL218_08392 [Daldinia childiae]|uniref:uncharacterized protein n=1 Tax=Daldinia childiae TaxID=326645 RepID=UPI0014480EB4|nr:uncharacterized protein GL218_08392 [Daldinia childiae]KAF3068384.1 hypothetical protein GL218_08392 [Daldinia childiae]